MKTRLVAWVAGAGLATAAILAHGLLPFSKSSARNDLVTAAVRTDLGQLKWVVTEATDYTPLEAEGRRLYLQAGCTYCHSQYSQPLTSETRPWGFVSNDPRRWGPPTQPGEYSYDAPPSFGTRGIAPDLSREGLKYSEEWHLAHYWNPPLMTKGSIMGGFSGLFDAPSGTAKIVGSKTSAKTLGRTLERTPLTEHFFDFASKEKVKLTPNDQGLLFVPLAAQHKYPVIWTPQDQFSGDEVRLVGETRQIQSLIAYVQKLGTNRGVWRDAFDPGTVEGSDISLPRSDEWIARGKVVYENHCLPCHGPKGDGNGPASTFLYKQRPRNFTFGVFKFRLNTGTLPTDMDLLRTISRGVRGTAMPAWFELPLEERLAVIQYVKYELAADRSDPDKPQYYFVQEPPGPPMQIATPPPPTAEMLARGKEVWRKAECWECHGDSGKGDGKKAPGLTDDWRFPIRPANLTRGWFKSGPAVTDVFRTITTGLSGTPMPSFQDAFPEEDRWALAYYILSLSAFTNPLAGEPIPISAGARAALDDPGLAAFSPRSAYGLGQACGGSSCESVDGLVAVLAGASK